MTTTWKLSRIYIPNTLTLSRIATAPCIGWLLWLPSWRTRFLALCLFAVSALTDGLDGWLARRWSVTSDLGAWLDPLADKVFVAATLIPLWLALRGPGLWTAQLSPDHELLSSSALHTPWGLGGIPGWIVVVILGREILVTVWRARETALSNTVAQRSPVDRMSVPREDAAFPAAPTDLRASWTGKAKTIAQVAWLGSALAWITLLPFSQAASWAPSTGLRAVAYALGSLSMLSMGLATIFALASLVTYAKRWLRHA